MSKPKQGSEANQDVGSRRNRTTREKKESAVRSHSDQSRSIHDLENPLTTWVIAVESRASTHLH